jgi:putative N-acetylmannosamine-6-phosphate epimerase
VYFIDLKFTKKNSLDSISKAPEKKCNACYQNDCSNNSTCHVGTHNGFEYECVCAPGYYGEKCNQTIDACYGQPCKNKGVCRIVMEGRYK